MNQETQETQDSRATAYVFGELSPDEVVKFEQELVASAELRHEVAGIEEAVAAVQAELDSQTRGVSEADRARIESAMTRRPSAATASPSNPAATQRQWLVRLAIAASVVLLVGLAIPALRQMRQRELANRLELARSQAEAASASPSAGVITDMEATLDRDADETIILQAELANLEKMVEASERLSRRSEQVVSELEVLSAGRQANLRGQLTELSAANGQDESRSNLARALAESRSGAAASGKTTRHQIDALGIELTDSLETSAKPSETRYSLQAPAPMLPAQAETAPAPVALSLSPVLTRTTEALRKERQVVKSRGIATKTERDFGLAESSGESRGRITTPEPNAPRGGEKSDEAEFSDGLLPDDAVADLGGGGDRFEPIVDNPFMNISQAPLSTFSIDVDTASYAKVRMYLMQHNILPQPDAVRIEEMLNYFSYDYEPPRDEHPFAASMAVAQCPWNPQHRLARIAIKGKVIEEQRPASNLVFLLDVSGSMNQPNKLPLVVSGMKMLTKQLGENDSVAIVVYAGAAGLVLDSTCGDDKSVIVDALDRLRAGGSTAGAQGIQLAYEVARDHFIVGGTNRVILCTDGDFNVGVTNTDQLVKIAEQNAKGDIFLSVLGFGSGNHNDAMMEKISNKGNGNYAFIDSEKEAHKVLVEQMGGTLVTIAKDVKIQVEFNPQEVSSYRLIGYENRVLAAEDFNDDKKDAGEIGAGHTVTALYELVPRDGSAELADPEVDDLRYQKHGKLSKRAKRGELLLLKLRYKQPTGTTSTLMEAPVKDEGKTFSEMDNDFKFAGTVAAFGMMLRGSPHKGNLTFAAVEEMAGDGIGQDKHGRRAEFSEMVARAKELSGE